MPGHIFLASGTAVRKKRVTFCFAEKIRKRRAHHCGFFFFIVSFSLFLFFGTNNEKVGGVIAAFFLFMFFLSRKKKRGKGGVVAAFCIMLVVGIVEEVVKISVLTFSLGREMVEVRFLTIIVLYFSWRRQRLSSELLKKDDVFQLAESRREKNGFTNFWHRQNP